MLFITNLLKKPRVDSIRFFLSYNPATRLAPNQPRLTSPMQKLNYIPVARARASRLGFLEREFCDPRRERILFTNPILFQKPVESRIGSDAGRNILTLERSFEYDQGDRSPRSGSGINLN